MKPVVALFCLFSGIFSSLAYADLIGSYSGQVQVTESKNGAIESCLTNYTTTIESYRGYAGRPSLSYDINYDGCGKISGYRIGNDYVNRAGNLFLDYGQVSHGRVTSSSLKVRDDWSMIVNHDSDRSFRFNFNSVSSNALSVDHVEVTPKYTRHISGLVYPAQ